jgi:predicted cobalt transporter CbtA
MSGHIKLSSHLLGQVLLVPSIVGASCPSSHEAPVVHPEAGNFVELARVDQFENLVFAASGFRAESRFLSK